MDFLCAKSTWQPKPKGACKPSSVPNKLGGDHLSRAAVTRRLVRPTREIGSEQPPAHACGGAHSHTWPCSRWGLPGRSCRHAAGGLLRHLFTLTCPAHAEQAVCFCGPSPRVAPPGHYPAPRSVELGLSSPCQRCTGRGRPAPLGKSILARRENDVKRKTSYCYTRHENSLPGTLGDSYSAW